MPRVLAKFVTLALSAAVGLSPTSVLAAPDATSRSEAPHGAEPAPETMAAPEPEPAPKQKPPGHGLVVAGVAITVGGVAAYALFGAGLAIGNRAEQDLAALSGSEDIERRRDLLSRGQLGNRIAIAGGIVSAVTLAVGIPLIVVGRRRATNGASSHRQGSRLSLGLRGAGAFIRVRI